MTSRKDQEIDRVVRKSTKDLMNSRMGTRLNRRALKGGMP